MQIRNGFVAPVRRSAALQKSRDRERVDTWLESGKLSLLRDTLGGGLEL